MVNLDNCGLTWNVFVGDFNHGIIETHNVFDHYRFMDDCRYAAKKYKDDRDEFEKYIKRSLMYYYWSKCEWEVVIDHWPHSDRRKAKKVDAYDQVMMNWEHFINYVWEHAVDLRRRKKKIGT